MKKWWAGFAFAYLTPLVCLVKGHRFPEHAPGALTFCDRCGDYNWDEYVG